MKKNFFYKKHMGIDLNVRNNGIKRLKRVYSHSIGSFNNYVTVESSTHYFDPPTLLRNARCDRWQDPLLRRTPPLLKMPPTLSKNTKRPNDWASLQGRESHILQQCHRLKWKKIELKDIFHSELFREMQE